METNQLILNNINNNHYKQKIDIKIENVIKLQEKALKKYDNNLHVFFSEYISLSI